MSFETVDAAALSIYCWPWLEANDSRIAHGKKFNRCFDLNGLKAIEKYLGHMPKQDLHQKLARQCSNSVSEPYLI